jgi:DNA-binding NarL/FixJ family response regulator
MMSKPRILLGDDHDLIIEGLRSLLAKDFEIMGVASNGREVVAAAERLKPDAVLLDVSMPILSGIEAARQIKESLPNAKLVFLTQKSDRQYVQAALRLGASGYILK